MIGNIGIMRGITGMMSWTDKNAAVIAQNIANADTPGYRPKALKDQDFSAIMALPNKGDEPKLKMTATNEGHLGGAVRTYRDGVPKAQKVVYESSPNDNGVVIEEQMFKASKNSMEQQLMNNLFRRNTGMYRMVLQGSGR